MTTYYVDGAVGSDSNAGTAEGAGNAWATIAKAIATWTSGDHVYVKASVTYTETVTESVTVLNTPPYTILEGYSSTPGDLGRVTWAASTTACWNYGAVSSGIIIYRNFTFTGGSQFNLDFGTARDNLKFFNCRFTNCPTGFRGDNNFGVYFCEFDNITNQWIDVDSSFAAYYSIFQSSSFSVLNGPLDCNNGWTGDHSIFVLNSSNVQVARAPGYSRHCTYVGSGDQSTYGPFGTVNQVIGIDCYGNLFYNFDQSSAFIPLNANGYNQFLWNNVIAKANATPTIIDHNSSAFNPYPYNQEAWAVGDLGDVDPFADSAGGDFTLAAGSAAIDAMSRCVPGLLT